MVLLIFAGGWVLGISCRSAGLLRGLVLDSFMVVAGAAPAVACVGPRVVSVLSVSVVAQFPLCPVGRADAAQPLTRAAARLAAPGP